jgi:vacuolar-type H+-ATPase subunit H
MTKRLVVGMAVMASALLAGSLAWAADPGPAAEPTALTAAETQDLERWRAMTPEQRQDWLKSLPADKRERMKQVIAEARSSEWAEDFLTGFLNENEAFIKERDAHAKAMKEVQGQLRALRDSLRPALRDQKLTREQKEQAIADAKPKARELLGKLMDERIRFQKAVNNLIVKNRDQIIDKATDAIFARGGAALVRRSDGAKRGAAAREGKEPGGAPAPNVPPPPPPMP